MSTRVHRTAAGLVALLFGMLTVAVSPISAQDSTSAATADVEQPVTVGDTELTWTGDWEVDPSNSSSDQTVLSLVDTTTGTIMIATFGEVADVNDEGPQAFLDSFSGGFAESLGSGSLVETGSGELENGAVWRSYTLTLGAIQLTLVATVSETTDGVLVVSTLTANTGGFEEAAGLAQTDIMLNGEPTFLDGIDAAAVASATPVASPESTLAS